MVWLLWWRMEGVLVLFTDVRYEISLYKPFFLPLSALEHWHWSLYITETISCNRYCMQILFDNKSITHIVKWTISFNCSYIQFQFDKSIGDYVLYSGVLCCRLVRVSDFFPDVRLLIWRSVVQFPMPSPLPIWTPIDVYNLQHHQRPVALIPSLYGVGG